MKRVPKSEFRRYTIVRLFKDDLDELLDIFKNIWIRLLEEYNRKEGIKLAWQSLDSISIKSPLGGR